MSRSVFLFIVDRDLKKPLENLRNTLIVATGRYQHHIGLMQPLAKKIQTENSERQVSTCCGTIQQAFGFWEQRKPLMLDLSRGGTGEGLVNIIDDYVTSVENTSRKYDGQLDGSASGRGYSKNCVRRMLGLYDQILSQEFANLDHGMPSVTISDIMKQGVFALDPIYAFLAKHGKYIRPVSVPQPGPQPTPVPTDLHSQAEQDYVDFEQDVLENKVKPWIEELQTCQHGFIGRLRNVDSYRQLHPVLHNQYAIHESQAGIFNTIAGAGGLYASHHLHNLTTGKDETVVPAISIVQIQNDDGTTGILVRAAGVNTNEGYPGANVPFGAIAAGSGYEGDYYNDVQKAIADYFARTGLNSATTPITFEVHSMGGIVAQQLGDSGQTFAQQHNIKEIVTFGSPNELSNFGNSTEVHLYTNMGDPVPLFSRTGIPLTVVTSILPGNNPFTNQSLRWADTFGETIVDGGTSNDFGTNHGAYGQSQDLQNTSVNFLMPGDKGYSLSGDTQTYYYNAPTDGTAPQTYTQA